MLSLRFLLVASAAITSNGFQSLKFHTRVASPFQSSQLFRTQQTASGKDVNNESEKRGILHSFMRRLDTTKAAGLEDAKMAGIISKIHGPITYLALGLFMGLKNRWCFRNPYYWFAMAFCVKWYRARYVFKIPVWDRQPNWNNIITSKEQEKDLKAFTCKKCGSTLFIAKSREFFFEGSTGIGGLGCFACGAKGDDMFVMDRDRIVEDVGDMDDYFEYERPLDFVSAAERRKVLKETGGDEEKANNLLVARASGKSTVDSSSAAEIASGEVEDAEVVETTINGASAPEKESTPESIGEESAPEPIKAEEPKTEAQNTSEKSQPSDDDFDIDDLGMDEF